MNKQTVSLKALKGFVRKEAQRYLKQANVTSVGIGYKIKDRKSSKELSIQFTVGRKVAPEALESIGAAELPKFLLVGGVQVPTDVLQRNYATSAQEVKLAAKLEAAAPRKGIANPVVPGISVGHPAITAGTVGCVVYDAATGAPHILSNWHVLAGATGQTGDSIVQPGKYDDSRVEHNVVGKLVRSYLGVAGDCAIASIDERRLAPEILDLNVAVQRVGEPELGDRVVKSGRTTDVTYGLVQRIHVTVRMDYEGAGAKQIGCFEIGPDAAHPARDGEISMGGDSGSVWLSVKGNQTTDMMLGLHFGGEVGNQPEFALACYAASVFEKLGVLPAKPTGAVAVGEAAASGFAPNFIGVSVPLPTAATTSVRNDLLVVGGRTVFDYTHFSLAMSKVRRFARWVAWNIDGSAIRKISRTGIPFIKDPRLPATAQVGDELYSNNPLDRGHIARRADLVWGPPAEAARANKDSFFFTNITPQHEDFNQSDAKGLWGLLENAIFEDVDVDNLRVSVLGGPVFSTNDPEYRGVKLPKQFWKIIYYRETGDPAVKARAFVLTQADLINQLETLELPEFSVYQVPISKVSSLTGLTLPSAATPESMASRRRRGPEVVATEAAPIRRITSARDLVG